MNVFDRIGNLRDIAQTDRRAPSGCDDKWRVVCRPGPRIVCIDLVSKAPVVDHALGSIGVRRGKRGPDILKANTVAGQGERIELHANRRQRRAADIDVTDTFQLQKLLLKNGNGDIIDLARRPRHGCQG